MRAFLIAIVALGVLCAGGAWNYQRNAYLDKDLEFRPFKTLTDAHLVQLLEAHKQNVVTLHMTAGKAPSVNMAGIDESDLEGKIAAFDRFERQNSAWKERHGLALQEQARVEGLEREQQIRAAGMDQEWRRILRRVSTF
jgi:hypothetical protein